MVRQARLAAGESVLDLGCGTGTLALPALAEQPRIELAGFDADPVVLDCARKKARAAGVAIELDEGLSTDLPYPDGRFDVVLSTLFFHHLADDDKRRTAAEVARVLKPGGRLVVADLGRRHGAGMRLTARLTT